ncbi:MAG: acyltransferase family protein, partial [Candidatus Dormibacteria bacterium]
MAGLDGLRAIAVMAVIAYHLNLGWAPGGLLGVGVFFVLSGYLITDLLLAQHDSSGRIALAQFWVRRARRLLPALWVMLVVVIVWVAVAQPSQMNAMRGDVFASFLYVSNWWYVVQHLSYFASFGPPSPLGHLWSLAVEEQFYLLWPLLLIVAARFVRNRRIVVLLVVLGAIGSATAMGLLFQPGGDPNRTYYGTDTRAFELLIGAALAMVWPSRRMVHRIARNRRVLLDITGAAGLLVIGAMVWTTNQDSAFIYRGGLVLLSFAAAAAVAALAHPSTWVSRILGAQPLRWIGVRSYGIYLWHFPIIVLTTPIVDTPGAHWVRSALQLAACIAIAALSWRYIEDPIRRGGVKRVAERVRAVRWPIVGLPAGLWDAVAASSVPVLFAGAGVAGVVAITGGSTVSELTASATGPGRGAPVSLTQPCARSSL